MTISRQRVASTFAAGDRIGGPCGKPIGEHRGLAGFAGDIVLDLAIEWIFTVVRF